jgi:hypothetical protein
MVLGDPKIEAAHGGANTAGAVGAAEDIWIIKKNEMPVLHQNHSY